MSKYKNNKMGKERGNIKFNHNKSEITYGDYFLPFYGAIQNRNLNFPSGYYNNCNEILIKFGWHIFLTGSTIYSSKVIKQINKINFKNSTNFPQFYLIFIYL